MCAVTLLFFFMLLSTDIYIFGELAKHVDAFWIWSWNLAMIYVGWQLIKRRFNAQRAEKGLTLKIDASYRAPFLLLIPGLLSDGVAICTLGYAYLREQRYHRRRRASSLWVGKPGADGVIKVEAVRVKPAEPQED